MSRAWKIAGIIALLVIVPGGIYAGMGLMALNQTEIEVKSYKVKSVDTQFVHMDIVLEIKNPSKLDVSIEGYDLRVDINGIKVASIISKYAVVLDGLGKTLLTVPVAIDFKKSFDVVKSREILGYFLTRNKEKIIVSLTGKLKGEILKMPISTRLNFKYSLKEIEDLMKAPNEIKKV